MVAEGTSPNDRLRSARHLKGWTQSELAERLNTDFETVSRWERGISIPSASYRQRLCEVLGKTAEELGLLTPRNEPLPSLDTPFVFFSSSYADANSEFVLQCKTVLQARNITVWDDRQVGRHGAENRNKALREAIHAAHAVLLIASPEARSSRHIRNALLLARMYSRTICAVWIAGEQWQQCIPDKGDGLQTIIDARQTDNQAIFDEIIARLEENWNHTQEAALPDPLPVQPPTNFEPRNPYKGLCAFSSEDLGSMMNACEGTEHS